MNWKAFWRAVDAFGERGAPRCEWRWALGNEFASFEPMLRAGRSLAGSLHDPEDLTQAMEIFESSEDCFEAHSTAIPPHREPMLVPRSELVMLTVNASAVAKTLAPELGFVAGEFRSRGFGALFQMGVCSVAGLAPLPVFLFLGGKRPRVVELTETLLQLPDSIVLMPSLRGVDETTRSLAAQRAVILRTLDTEPDRVLSGIQPGAVALPKGAIKPVFLPQPGWTWDMLELDFSHERFVAAIGNQRFEGRWTQHGVRVLHNGQATDFVELLIQLARRERLDQSRHAPAQRKRVSRFRETLRQLFQLEGEPIRNGVAAFRVSTRLARRTERAVAE